MFKPLPDKFSFPQAEQEVLAFWERSRTFEKTLEQRRGAPRFVFYEGPPTANGLPHPGHCLTRAMKDLFPRYQTMCGKLVERKAGWDTHGLPVEVEVCKELGIHTKEEIEQYGVEKFVRLCIDSVFRYVKEWETMTRRLGFWVNLEEAYVTFHQQYVESVWWGLKTLYERGLLYQGHKVVWWWAQGGTALSAGEVGEGYRTVQDPSVYVKFPIVRDNADAPRPELRRPHDSLPPDAEVSLLVWTTTPWTLVSNHFAAVGPDIDYTLVHDKTAGRYLYIATALVDLTMQKLKHAYEAVGVCKGTDLARVRYVPPFDCYYRTMAEQTAELKDGGEDYVGWRVTLAEFVTLDSGTGLVHEAPAYGEVDFELLQAERKRFKDELHSIPLINAVGPDGTFNDEAPPPYRGRWVKDCDKDIMRELRERGVLLHQEMIEHEYPFCPRAEEDPLIQYARESWFVRTSEFKEEFLENNAAITWLPEHIKEGRFGDFLRNNVDWALSRERYWGTPLPIWKCEKTGKMEAVGSLAELKAKPGATDGGLWVRKKAEDPSLPDHLMVHKPYIDEWTYDSPFAKAGEHGPPARMRRVPEVIDCWWDAGSMPFAQWGFPHAPGSIETFAERFPADFISEALDQTRGWFYGLLAISTLLFSEAAMAASGGSPAGGTGVSPAAEPSASLGGVGVSPARSRGADDQLKISHRRALPHWEAGGSTYFITFRTGTKQTGGGLVELSPAERDIVLGACRHWDRVRINLHAVVVMPEHVHLLMTPLEKSAGVWWPLEELLHSIKGFSAHEINRLRGRKGATVWQDERYDRIIRSADDFAEKLNYIISNPQMKGLPGDYPWLWVEPDHVGPNACSVREEKGGRDAHPTREKAVEHLHRNYPHPYRACIVLGLMMGEDGLKMSKRKKNYREPNYIFEHYGADAMRWFFFSGQTPWTSVRFEEQNIRDAHREFLVRLYNVFSFFTIYANIDGFERSVAATEQRRHEATKPRSHEGENPPVVPPARGDESGHGGTEPEGPEGENPPVSPPAREDGEGHNGPDGTASALPRGTGWRPVRQRSELDRWIIGELHRTTRFVREKMDAFENYPAAGRINDFVDALSNWYVRRSRERFWKPVHAAPHAATPTSSAAASGPTPMPAPSDADQDKWDAYNTLYEVLFTLSRLIAPFTPFFAETMYQHLRGIEGEGTEGLGDGARTQPGRGKTPRAHEAQSRNATPQSGKTPALPGRGGQGADAPGPQSLDPSIPQSLPQSLPESVHLCAYPVADEALIDEDLALQMDLVRQIVSQGRAARTAARLKVRQPLALVEIILARREHTAWLQAHSDLIADELNIKQVEFTTEADHYVTYQLKPEFKALGPKFGKMAPKVAKAIQQLAPADARRQLDTTGELFVEVDRQQIRLDEKDVNVQLQARSGWSAAEGRAGVVVVKTELTPELIDEGLTRELIHHVQNLRKSANLPYEARITLHVETDDELRGVIEKLRDTVRHECLAEEIVFGPAPAEAHEVKVESHPARLAIERR